MRKDLRIAVLGTMGAVGEEFRKILAQRNFPFASIKFLGSSKSKGKEVTFQGKKYLIEEASKDSFKDIDLVLSSPGGSVSKELVPHAVKAGALVVDNTSAFRMDPNVPLVVPEINPEDIAKHKGIIANPNCSTIIMLVPLFPIHKIAKIKRIVAATYQAVSGAGQTGIKALDDQIQEIVVQGKKESKTGIFGRQVAFNVFSHNSAIKEDGYCEEEIKMMKETKKIFHDDQIQVVATTIRVPVYRAHSEALFIETEKPLSLEQLYDALKNAEGVKIVDDREGNNFPTPVEASGGDDVLVGRIRKDPTVQNGFALFVSGDQIRKGAALNAVQIAEKWAGK